MINAQRNIEEGKNPMEGAIAGTQEVWAPVTASVLTTVFAFLPMMFMSGIFGKFVRNIPIGVVIALIISLWECFFILPHHMGAWVKSMKKEDLNKGLFVGYWNKVITPGYVNFVKTIVRVRWLALVVLFCLFIGSGYFAKNYMDFELFPKGAVEIFKVDIETQVGTPLSQTGKIIAPIEKAISELPENEFDDYTTLIGMRGNDGDPNRKRGSEYASITVYLTPQGDRKRSAQQIIDDLREKIGKPKDVKRIIFGMAAGGPPVGKAISIGVRGREYPVILKAVKEIEDILKKQNGVSDIENGFIVGKQEIHVVVNGAEARAAGLGVAEVGTGVRAAYEGLVATTIKKLDEEIDIRVSMTEKDRGSLKTLRELQIPNRSGSLVRLKTIAKFEEAKGIAVYEHENNERQVRITGEVDSEVISSIKANNVIRDLLPELRKKHPEVSFHFGGEDADTRESMASLLRAFSLAVFAIFLLLILLFKNLYQPLVVILAIPLGIISVIWAFALHDMPLSFLGLIGLIALGGVIVNNAIVFVDFVNKLRKSGQDRFESIYTAAAKRIRPIFLTTLTTVAGILPTVYGWGGLDPFVVPVALSLGWGLFLGSILTTIFLPALLAAMDDVVSVIFIGERRLSARLMKRKIG